MAAAARILAFAGSARVESLNKKVLAVAVAGARAAGAEVTLVDLREYPLPIYDGDWEVEHGLPDVARALRGLFLEHRGLLIAAPEYNSSITPLLKNTIDWVTRTDGARPSLECFEGKVAGLVSAGPGNFGGLRGLVHVRSILGNIRVLVVPEQVAVPRAGEAFDETGKLKDARQNAAVEGVGAAVVRLVAKLYP
jgi:NAD(P)H-dependent FMN reductase